MQPTNLAPEFVRFSPGGTCRMFNGANQNQQRPEALESMFILWRITKDPKYRENAWTIFQAFNRYARVKTGGTSFSDASRDNCTPVTPLSYCGIGLRRQRLYS